MEWLFARLTGEEVAGIAVVTCAIALAMFLLRPRPPTIAVGSHVLWEQILPKRHNPLLKELAMLLLQIIALVALAVALGDPRPDLADAARGDDETAPTERVWVVDRSLSMSALEPDGRTRLEKVRDRLLAELDSLPPQVSVALVGAGSTPALLAPFGDDRSRTRLALRTLETDGVRADLGAALRLATGTPGPSDPTIEIFTDDPDAASVVLERNDVRIRSPFTPGPNLALAAFDLRGSRGLPAEEEALVRIHNPTPWSATVTLSLETAEAILGEDVVTVAPGEDSVRRYRFLPLPSSGIEAVLHDATFADVPEDVPSRDVLPADDRAFGWIEPVRPARVMLVSDGNRFLERVLALLPGVELIRVAPDAYTTRGAPRAQDVDLVFFDGVGPGAAEPPPRAFFVNPGPKDSPFGMEGRFEAPAVTDFNYEHPVLSGVLLRDLQVELGSVLRTDDGDERLLGSPSGALALARSGPNGEKWIGWGFDFADSDLPLRLAFPQTIVNALLWARDGRAVGLPAGSRGRLAETEWLGAASSNDATATVITDLLRAKAGDRPSARARETTAAGDGPHAHRFARPGLYRIDEPEGSRSVAVNVFDTSESDTLSLPDDDPSSVPVPTAPEAPEAPRPWWVWLAVFAAAVAFLEFGLYTR